MLLHSGLPRQTLLQTAYQPYPAAAAAFAAAVAAFAAAVAAAAFAAAVAAGDTAHAAVQWQRGWGWVR